MDEFFQQTFSKLGPDDFRKGEYQQCVFSNCDFSNVDFSGSKFIECEFNGCGLSLVMVAGTTLNDVRFTNCKMLGWRFDQCNPFTLSFSFDHCVLNDSSFFKVKMKKTVLRNSQLHHVDFGESDLSEVILDHCDLKGAMFESTNLQKADLRTATNFSIDPEVNQVRKAKFSEAGLRGLLDKYDIVVNG